MNAELKPTVRLPGDFAEHLYDALAKAQMFKWSDQLRKRIEASATPATAEMVEGELRIGVAASQEGAAVCIMQPQADGSITVIYQGTHPIGDSLARAAITADRASREAAGNALNDILPNEHASRDQQPAGAQGVKPWQERVRERWPRAELKYLPDNLKCEALEAENADLRARLARQSQGEPIYQVQFLEESGSSAWRDASEDAYQTFMPERRRIVYTTPQPDPASQSQQVQGDDLEGKK